MQKWAPCYIDVENSHTVCVNQHIDDLMQDCSISSALAMEILQSCTKPSRRSCHSPVVPSRIALSTRFEYLQQAEVRDSNRQRFHAASDCWKITILNLWKWRQQIQDVYTWAVTNAYVECCQHFFSETWKLIGNQVKTIVANGLVHCITRPSATL